MGLLAVRDGKWEKGERSRRREEEAAAKQPPIEALPDSGQ